MTNSILVLIIAGILLAIFHIPSVVITLGVIGGLAFFTIKLFWRAMQLFSASHQKESMPARGT
ncbi:MAG: hypothetical protein AAGB19_01945 [Cyanobacteria bacterium P01_F01_bin.3]